MRTVLRQCRLTCTPALPASLATFNALHHCTSTNNLTTTTRLSTTHPPTMIARRVALQATRLSSRPVFRRTYAATGAPAAETPDIVSSESTRGEKAQYKS